MYVTTEEVREAAEQLTETAVQNGVLGSYIERASRMFDLICGLDADYFEARAEGVATALVIYGNGSNFLQLPPYVVGSLDSTISVPDGYTVQDFIEKDGYLIRTNNGVLATDYNTLGGWYLGVPITVTAKWGYESTPQDVKAAVIELVINLWRETDPAHLQLRSLEGGLIRENMPPRVKEIARRYRAKTGVFI